MSFIYKCYFYTRKVNYPRITAVRAWEYVKCLESYGLLSKAFPHLL